MTTKSPLHPSRYAAPTVILATLGSDTSFELVDVAQEILKEMIKYEEKSESLTVIFPTTNETLLTYLLQGAESFLRS